MSLGPYQDAKDRLPSSYSDRLTCCCVHYMACTEASMVATTVASCSAYVFCMARVRNMRSSDGSGVGPAGLEEKQVAEGVDLEEN